MYEKETNPFYGSTAWKAARRAALDRDHGLCVLCRKAGRTRLGRDGRRYPVRATMVHHIKHLDEHPELALDLKNLVSLCDDCHDKMHPEKHRGKPEEAPLAVRMGIRVETIGEEG